MTEAQAEPRRVLLIGFMASGKTTVGRRVAELLGWSFIDFDEEIERRTGATISQIFRYQGEAYFRELEAQLTHEIADRFEVVLAPGGGWITQPDLLDALKPGTLVVWLRVSPEEAVRRASRTISHRPLLATADPVARARELVARREPLYRMAADAIVDVDGRDSADVAREVVEHLHSRTKDP